MTVSKPTKGESHEETLEGANGDPSGRGGPGESQPGPAQDPLAITARVCRYPPAFVEYLRAGGYRGFWDKAVAIEWGRQKKAGLR